MGAIQGRLRCVRKPRRCRSGYVRKRRNGPCVRRRSPASPAPVPVPAPAPAPPAPAPAPAPAALADLAHAYAMEYGRTGGSWAFYQVGACRYLGALQAQCDLTVWYAIPGIWYFDDNQPCCVWVQALTTYRVATASVNAFNVDGAVFYRVAGGVGFLP